jgi:hypothetical protein
MIALQKSEELERKTLKVACVHVSSGCVDPYIP